MKKRPSAKSNPCRLPRRRLGDNGGTHPNKRAHATTLLAGIRAGGTPSKAFPNACSRRSVACGWRESRRTRPLTVAGAAQARCAVRQHFLLPVELQYVNHTASTNGGILRPFTRHNLTIEGCMATPSPTDQIAERVERLLMRHAELQRTNMLLTEQVSTLTQERDSLKSRLNAARARVDALLERLPAAAPVTKEIE